MEAQRWVTGANRTFTTQLTKRYEWFLYTKKSSIPLLKSVLPYLICKKEQMKIAIEFIKTVGKMGKELSRDTYNHRKDCKERLNLLNARGRTLND